MARSRLREGDARTARRRARVGVGAGWVAIGPEGVAVVRVNRIPSDARAGVRCAESRGVRAVVSDGGVAAYLPSTFPIITLQYDSVLNLAVVSSALLSFHTIK